MEEETKSRKKKEKEGTAATPQRNSAPLRYLSSLWTTLTALPALPVLAFSTVEVRETSHGDC